MTRSRYVLRLATIALGCSVVALAACSDRDAASLTGVQSRAKLEAPSIDAQINALITEIFKQGHATAVRTRWENTKRENMRNPESRKKHVALIRWLQSKTADVTPAEDETREHAVARLVLLMSLYLYGGPATVPPEITPATDATLEIVEPTQTDTAVTPAKQAAVIFPAGAVSEPTVVVVSENEEPFEQECSGPLPTTRCQYPTFYRFDVFPDVKLNTPAMVSVCHVNSGHSRLPRADHDRFRLAHQKPSDPSAYHPEGTIEGDIEILPLISVGSLVDCEETEHEHHHGALPPDAGVFARLAARVTNGAYRVASGIGAYLTPKSLYAIDRGGGGSVLMFSDFNVIDPGSQADLLPRSFTLSSTDLTRGGEVTVSAFSVANDGSGPATSFATAIVMATDTALSEGVVTLATLPAVAALNPDVLAAVAATTVTIPAGTALGAYYVGVKVDNGNAVAEEDEANNTASVRVVVRDDYVLFCPDGPEGSYSTLRAAVDAAPAGGTVAVCDGEHNVDSVRIDKPITLTAQNTGFNAWLGDVDPAFGGQVGRGAIRIDGIDEGVVRIENLGFRHNGRAVIIGQQSFIGESGPVHAGRWDRVEMNNVRFEGRHAEGGIGVQVWQSGTRTGRVDITNARFETQFIGVFVTSHSEVNVSQSTFDGFTAGSVTYSGFTPSDPAQQRLAFGNFTDNTVRNCGVSGCFRGVLMTNGTIARNTFEAGGAESKTFGIWVSRPTNTPHARQPIVIEDNVVVSSGMVSDGAPNAPASWNVQFGIQLQDAPGVTNIIRRNQVSNSFQGMAFAGPAEAYDNRVSGGYAGFGAGSAFTTRIERNDIVGTTIGFFAPANNANNSSFRCNWWGSASGPTTPPGASYAGPPYAPWASAPIAGTATDCDPTASLMTVRACPAGPGGSPLFTVASVAQAYSIVQDGGTVRLCNATHAVAGLNVRKSVTFEPDGAFRPIVDAGGGPNSFFISSPTATAASVVIRGLRLQNASSNNIGIQQNYGTVSINDMQFLPSNGVPAEGTTLAYNGGVGVFGATGNGITIQNSTFTGGDIGVHTNNAQNVVVLNNLFTNQANAALHAGNGGTFRAEHNTINGCGQFWCIGVFTGGSTELRNNAINVDFARPVVNAIQVHDGAYVMSGNVITGTGGNRDVNMPNTWPIQNGISVGNTGPGRTATATLDGNTVNGSFGGMSFHEGTSGSAADNVITNVRQGMTFYRTSMTLHRSNITNYTLAIGFVFESPEASATCNWWGSVEGPNGVPAGLGASFYTPFATQPIAGTAVACPAP